MELFGSSTMYEIASSYASYGGLIGVSKSNKHNAFMVEQWLGPKISS